MKNTPEKKTYPPSLMYVRGLIVCGNLVQFVKTSSCELGELRE